MKPQGKLSATSRRQRGQAAVEFALVVVFLVVLLVSILEMTMFIYTYAALTNAAKEGVRYAIVHGASTGVTVSGSPASSPWPLCTTTATGTILSTVQTYAALSLHNTSSMSINACYPDGDNKPGSAVQVRVSYPYQPLFGLRWASVTISANSVGRIAF
jgi:Flp pilus assembly protein TadG